MAVALESEDGRVVAPEIFKWTLENSKIPDIGGTFFFVEFGLMIGATVDFMVLGEQVSEMVEKILNGKKAKDIPIEDSKSYATCINLARAEHLGINVPQSILDKCDSDKIYKLMKLYPDYEYKGQ